MAHPGAGARWAAPTLPDTCELSCKPSQIETIRRAAVVAVLLLSACGGGSDLLLPGKGDPAAVTLTGNGQNGRVGEALPQPLVAAVTDGAGRPVEGATVVFVLTDPAPGASLNPDTTTTDRRRYCHGAGGPGHTARHAGGRSAGARQPGPGDSQRHLQSQCPARERQRHHRREWHGTEWTGRHRARESAGGPDRRRIREPDSGRRRSLDSGRWWQCEQPHDHHRRGWPDLGNAHAGHYCRDAAHAGQRWRARGLAGDVRA